MRFHRLFCQTSTSRTHLSFSTNENARLVLFDSCFSTQQLLNVNVSPRVVAKQVVDMSEDMLICTPLELHHSNYKRWSVQQYRICCPISHQLYMKRHIKTFCNGHKNIMSKTTVKMYSLHIFQKSQRYANHQRFGVITQC